MGNTLNKLRRIIKDKKQQRAYHYLKYKELEEDYQFYKEILNDHEELDKLAKNIVKANKEK